MTSNPQWWREFEAEEARREERLENIRAKTKERDKKIIKTPIYNYIIQDMKAEVMLSYLREWINIVYGSNTFLY